MLDDGKAFCVARTVNAARLKKDAADDPRFGQAASVLGLEMSSWFAPTADSYFSKVSKALILDALREGKGNVAPAWEKARKGDLAAMPSASLPERAGAQTLRGG